jgi:uncharacterized YccA/Bax inhibitor family protein
MATPLPVRSGNPVLTDDVFRGTRVFGGETMTIGGTVNKTVLALAILCVAAAWTWNLGPRDPRVGMLTMVGMLGGLAMAVATTWRKDWAAVTAPLYAAFEGLLLGGVSASFETRYPGLVGQAVFLTIGTLATLLLAYRAGFIRATDTLRRTVFAATGGIMLVYVADLVMRLFGTGVPLIHGSTPIGIGFSLVVVAVAAFNLVLDFDFIERAAARGAPRQMEWYGAFALLVTLVWLYLEMLRLLTKLQERR